MLTIFSFYLLTSKGIYNIYQFQEKDFAGFKQCILPPFLHDILRFIFKNLYILILFIRQCTVCTKCIFNCHLWLPFASVSWPIRDVCWSHISNNCWRKSTGHGHGINTRFKVLDSLPLSYPTIFHLACSNHTIKVWRCTIVPVRKR